MAVFDRTFTVGTTKTRLTPREILGHSALVENTGAVTCYISGLYVDTASRALAAGEEVVFNEMKSGEALYSLTASSSTTVHVTYQTG